MGGSRRKFKASRKSKVRVGLPKKNPNVFKPAFNLPQKLRSIIDSTNSKWDDKASVIKNYKAFGFVSNPNILGKRSRTPHQIQSSDLQLPISLRDEPLDEFEVPVDTGSDLEEDDLKSALGKKRRDGTSGQLQPLTNIQRIHIGRLIEKHGEDYQSMFMDTKLNSMQHSVATLEKLCKRYHVSKDKNPMILTR
ncbi:hypothetical protein MKX03_017342 [Papaver bracteatum]|nr:hypothetical protein MKX03_017342 [Papaver bracteatum]